MYHYYFFVCAIYFFVCLDKHIMFRYDLFVSLYNGIMFDTNFFEYDTF